MAEEAVQVEITIQGEDGGKVVFDLGDNAPETQICIRVEDVEISVPPTESLGVVISLTSEEALLRALLDRLANRRTT